MLPKGTLGETRASWGPASPTQAPQRGPEQCYHVFWEAGEGLWANPTPSSGNQAPERSRILGFPRRSPPTGSAVPFLRDKSPSREVSCPGLNKHLTWRGAHRCTGSPSPFLQLSWKGLYTRTYDWKPTRSLQNTHTHLLPDTHRHTHRWAFF